MDYFKIGNLIGLIGSLILVSTGAMKNKKKLIMWQTIQIALFVASNLLLGGIPGAIVNVFCLIRNILCYFNKFGNKEKALIIIISTAVGIYTNNLGLIGFLPILSNVIYTLFMDVKDIKIFKILFLITEIMWFVYDLCIKLYTSMTFDAITIVVTLVVIFTLFFKKDKTTTE